MTSFVVNAVCFGPECLAASKSALERPLVCVNCHVDFEIGFLIEGFATPRECTLVWLATTVFFHVITEA